MAEADKVAAGALQQAIGVLRNIFSSPETVKSLASSLERPTGSSDHDLEGYKDTISNKYKKLLVSSYMGRPI